MSELKMHQPGRIAMRQEGDWWQAYWAPMDTMEGAISIGNILISLVGNESAKQAFINALTHCVKFGIEESTGEFVVDWELRTAPEHERSGHG